MKPFDELTDEEVVALTDDQVQGYVDLACAEAGVPLLPEPPAEPEQVIFTPDITYYTIVGTTLEFLDKADALKVLDAIVGAKSIVDVGYIGNDYNAKKIKPQRQTFALLEGTAFSEKIADNKAEAIERATTTRAEFLQARTEYDAIVRKRGGVFAPFTARIGEAKKNERRRRQIRDAHAQYMKLAEGMRRTAARFLAAAYSDAPVLCPELFTFSTADPADPRAPRAYMNDEDQNAVV